ncbi:Transposase [Bacillus cereus Rock3-42]|nr:Transposase [Bacillus cereus Rock3-42]
MSRNFTFQITKEAFHDGIIMAISSPGHVDDNAVFFGMRLKFSPV